MWTYTICNYFVYSFVSFFIAYLSALEHQPHEARNLVWFTPGSLAIRRVSGKSNASNKFIYLHMSLFFRGEVSCPGSQPALMTQ